MTTHYEIEFRKTEGGRVIGWATCSACQWRVSLIDDTQAEVDTFLSAQLREHAVRLHGATFADEAPQ